MDINQHLVIGGTGKSGRRVTALLQDRGLPVIALSRPAFDWADPATWATVERPAAAAYLTFAPDLTFPGAPEAVAEVAERMARAGVRRVVLLSGRGEAEAQRAERLVADAAGRHGAGWAVVRCAFFLQNFDESLFAAPLAAGHVAFVAGDVREPFVDLDDVAEVVVGLMTGELPGDRVHELTGPELLTFAEAVAGIARAVGRPIGYEQVSPERLRSGLVAAGLPADDAAALVGLFSEVLAGHNAHLADGVEAALGRPATDLATWARRAAGNGAWPAEAAS